MNLIQDQRMKYLKFIRPLFIKSECEICGDMNRLELHHKEQFSNLLQETLTELNLEYNEDISMYTKEQRNVITDLMLGKQVRIKYTTVCSKCHITIHNIYGKEKTFSKGKVKNANKLKETLIDKYNGIKIHGEDKNELELIFRSCGYNQRTFGIYNANRFLEQLNISIKIVSKRYYFDNKRIRYWEILKL